MQPSLTEGWVQDTIEFLYGFRLRDFQLETQMALLSGGIYSIMWPTDWGKSMSLEQVFVLGLALEPNSRNIGIKINQAAAEESAEEVALKLSKLSQRYSWVEPQCRWLGGKPVVSKGFWVAGANRDQGRDINPSMRFYGLGSRDLQGKRGLRTLIDDVERMEEATSEAMSRQLRQRISAVSRTMQDQTIHPNMCWAIFGTPTHASSIHFNLAKDLEKLGVSYREIRITPFLADGSPRWPDRVQKMEIHRRLMDRREYAAAYEMRPIGQRQLSNAQIDACKDHHLRIPTDEEDWKAQLRAIQVRQMQDHAEHILDLTRLELYVGWDPATTGDWAISIIALLGDVTWVLRTHLGEGDTWDQVQVVKGYLEKFPSAMTVIERNGQQGAFIDLFRDLLPEQIVLPHGTYGNKHSEVIGIPGLMAHWERAKVRLPWFDAEASELEFEHLIDELKSYGPGAHPHVIPAVWFGWYWSRKHEMRPQTSTMAAPPRNYPLTMPQPQTLTPIRRESQKAWGRRWR